MTHLLLFTLLIPGFLFAQGRFNIELEAPSFLNDSLLLAPPVIRNGLEELYAFKLDTNKNIRSLGGRYGLQSSFYQLKIKEKNILAGQSDYPQPVSFQYYDAKEGRPYVSSTFFLDAGSYKIELPQLFHAYEVHLNSPINNEYAGFKKLLDKLTGVDQKQEWIGSYIKKHPHSYVAFWEIVHDYTFHDYKPIYLENLQLFSDAIKKTEIFRTFEGKLKVAESTMTGNAFPTVRFNKQQTLTKENFKKYKLTFIDYWSTSCAPCIRAMPQIVGMYNEYKEKGVQFITITDESEPAKIQTAETILANNKVEWKNYFDAEKDFKNKVNANGYPLHFLVDQNGIIVARMLGNVSGVKKIIDDHLSKP